MTGWFAALVFLAFGAGFVIGGVHRFRTTRAFLASARRAWGVVEDVRVVRSTDSNEYFPVLRFRTAEGADVRTVGELPGSAWELQQSKGRSVPVLYDPADPDRARVDTAGNRGASGAVGLVAAGCVLALIGVAILVGTAR
ncbi:DUF3592 domain-containing protein [Actinomadura parmotrematis]|uniref:DUF3592 domain-containing protein n=1 Tax=Actinomadura parmotrematis TaxID=2864039 RepID=A0ABS7FWY7_9ACTN|nr:DUF3592 domain-containing protein [Actinomadura parmotrematis]MBW8484941.1 DUF3592 domain-containing protein [Actinomadura parmotrematis]